MLGLSLAAALPHVAISRFLTKVDISASALDENVLVYNTQGFASPFVGTNEGALEALSASTALGRKTWALLGSSLGNDEDPKPFLAKLRKALGCVAAKLIFLINTDELG